MFGLFKKTVDSIVADIQQKIEHLHEVHAGKTTEADGHKADAQESLDKHVAATVEAARAKTLAERFTTLIS